MDFGRYVIQRSIATGGMAEIFLARQKGIEGVERQVVIKRILPGFSRDEEFVTMFLDEARLMAALSHPHVAQVFDLGFADESYYLVMEYVRGPTLGQLLKAVARGGETLPQAESIAIALAISEALAYVHGLHDEFGRPLQIVHRDLNPSNVVVSYDGAVKLIDFGIAKAATKVHETRVGMVKGTFGYVAPEQVTLTMKVDHRADVYSMGILLYEMCVGRHPFMGVPTRDIVKMMLQGDFPRPRALIPDFPQALDDLIFRCLAPHPEGRPSDVRTLATALATHMGSEGRVVTMPELAATVARIVPDQQGPEPLKQLQSQVVPLPKKDGVREDQTVPLHTGKLDDATMVQIKSHGATAGLSPPSGEQTTPDGRLPILAPQLASRADFSDEESATIQMTAPELGPDGRFRPPTLPLARRADTEPIPPPEHSEAFDYSSRRVLIVVTLLLLLALGLGLAVAGVT